MNFFDSTIQKFLETVTLAFDVTGTFSHQITERRNREFRERLRKAIRQHENLELLAQQAARERDRVVQAEYERIMNDYKLRRSQMEEQYEQARKQIEEATQYQIKMRARARQNLEEYRRTLETYRRMDGGFQRDAKALGSDWKRISADMETAFEKLKDKHPELSSCLHHVS